MCVSCAYCVNHYVACSCAFHYTSHHHTTPHHTTPHHTTPYHTHPSVVPPADISDHPSWVADEGYMHALRFTAAQTVRTHTTALQSSAQAAWGTPVPGVYVHPDLVVNGSQVQYCAVPRHLCAHPHMLPISRYLCTCICACACDVTSGWCHNVCVYVCGVGPWILVHQWIHNLLE